MKYDFSGWATRNNLKCSDGRTIMPNAFSDNDGQIVPLVWNHMHDSANNVLGHALLQNRNDGVYAYCTFNNTEQGQSAKELVKHGDVNALSIFANKLQQTNGNVHHGQIKEVSLVLSGANPGAYIDSIMMHGEESDEEAILYTGYGLELSHGEEYDDKSSNKQNKEDDAKMEDDAKTKNQNDLTIQDVIDSMTEVQKKVLYGLVGMAASGELGGNEEVKHNVFDGSNEYVGADDNYLSHAEQEAIFSDAKRYGSLKDSVLAHGINNIDYLFPDAQTIQNTPELYKRETDWVSKVMNAVHHTPFSRVKSIFANLTEDDARAKGYIKGTKKKEEVFPLLKRTTNPTTVYKKQKLDRDDVIDITDFDVVAWIKTEMRIMLDEEIARAILIGDGRTNASDDKINELNIRPIAFDDDFYTIKKQVEYSATDTDESKAKKFIRAAIKARIDYKGSGDPVLYTTEAMLTDCLLIEDGVGRIIYDTVNKLANALRVKEIITVPVMEGVKGANEGALAGIIVNLSDYNVGADKGGAVNMFDDFDIDYNAQKYLIETRCSGALIKPYSAIALEFVETQEPDPTPDPDPDPDPTPDPDPDPANG